MRQYGFSAEEILSDQAPSLNPYLDPKCHWALRNSEFFPVDVNKAPLESLLRVPGIGPTSARRIVVARRHSKLGMAELKRIGVVLKRAVYFILTKDTPLGSVMDKFSITKTLIDPKSFTFGVEQISLFDTPLIDNKPLLTDKEAALCLTTK